MTDFVLVIGGLCKKRDDGSYFFHSPYYGDTGSNNLRGLCYAADCERLDIASGVWRSCDGTSPRSPARYRKPRGCSW